MSKLSIITVCKNRLQTLLHVLPSFLQQDSAAEVIIADFDSDPPLFPELRDLLRRFSTLHLLRVNDQPVWKQGLAQNIGITFSNSDYFLKIDSDVEIVDLQPAYQLLINNHCDFIRGLYTKGVSSGTIMTRRDLFNDVGGYNDWFSGWGYDDGDLYKRLILHGKRRYQIFNSSLFHEIRQSMTTKNDNASSITSNFAIPSHDIAKHTEYSSLRNYILGCLLPQ